MTPFLKWLNEQLNAVQDFWEPDSVLEEGDEVIGEMDEDLRRLFTVYRSYRERLLAHIEALEKEYTSPIDLPEEERNELELMDERDDRLHDLFWQEVFETVGVHKPVGVRKGFLIVKFEREEVAQRVTSHLVIGLA